MAENEILDVGNPRRYAKWRAAVADSTCDVPVAVDALFAESLRLTGNQMRQLGKLLYPALKACGGDPAKLSKAVEALKQKHLVVLFERAVAITRSTDLLVIAATAAQLLTDKLPDGALGYCLRKGDREQHGRYKAIDAVTRAGLDEHRRQIAHLMALALQGGPVPLSAARRRKATAEAVNSTSLLQPSR